MHYNAQISSLNLKSAERVLAMIIRQGLMNFLLFLEKKREPLPFQEIPNSSFKVSRVFWFMFIA